MSELAVRFYQVRCSQDTESQDSSLWLSGKKLTENTDGLLTIMCGMSHQSTQSQTRLECETQDREGGRVSHGKLHL